MENMGKLVGQVVLVGDGTFPPIILSFMEV